MISIHGVWKEGASRKGFAGRCLFVGGDVWVRGVGMRARDGEGRCMGANVRFFAGEVEAVMEI